MNALKPPHFFGLAGITTLGVLPLFAQSPQAPTSTSLQDLTDAAPPSQAVRLYWGDFDVDGLEDALTVTSTGGMGLLLNAGDGTFVDATSEVGLGSVRAAAFAVWEDYDGDELPDVFIGTHDGPAYLLRNVGGMFVDVTEGSGIRDAGAHRRAHWFDVDRDGLLDLHLVSAQANTLYRGLGRGTFQAMPLPALVEDAGSGSALLGPDSPDGPRVLDRERGPVSTLGRSPANGGVQRLSGTRDNLSGGAVTVTPVGAGGSPSAPVPAGCVDSLNDPNGGGCIQASDSATLGMLYPLGENFFVEELTGDVGIGTTSPERRLHVKDGDSGTFPSTNSSIVVETDGESSISLISGAGDETSIFFGNTSSGGPNAGAVVYNPFNGAVPNGMVLRTDDSDRLAITETGEIGIGTTSPERLLHLKNGDSGTSPSTNSSLVVETDGESSISLISGAGDETSIFFGNTSSGGPNAGAVVYNPFNGAVPNGMVLRTDDSDRLAITETGDIGVGTTSPERLLHLKNGDSGTSPSTNSSLVVETDGESSISLISGAGDETSIFFGNTSSGGPNAGAVVYNPFNGAVPNGMVLRTDDSDRLAITESGDIGVGTTAPDARLHVADGSTGASANGNSKLVVEGTSGSATWIQALGDSSDEVGLLMGNAADGSDAGGISWESSLNRLELRSGGNRAMYLLPNGNVGVGTASPDRRLHVSSGSSGSAPTTNSDLVVEDDSEASISVLAPPNQEASLFFGNSVAGPNAGGVVFNPFGGVLPNGLVIRTADNNRIAVSATGNVGVNTITPTFTFEVNGTAGKPGGGSWSVSSDRRLKKNVQELDGALETVLALRGVTFEYKDPEAINELPGERLGFIAQEVEQVLPDWVEEIDGYKRLTVRGFEALTVEALRELSDQNAELVEANAELRDANELLEARVERLESLESELASLKRSLAALAATR